MACDDLISFGVAADADGLDDSVLGDAVGELSES